MFKRKSVTQLFAAFCAAAVTAGGMTSLSAAANSLKLVGYIGDVTGDLKVNSEDAAILRDYLLGIYPLDKAAGIYADLDQNGTVDSTDLTLLKRLLLTGESPVGIYDVTFDSALMTPPILALEPSLASVGETKIPVFAVDFPDCKFESDYTAEDIYNIAFGPEDVNSPAYPLESITAYYDRASYGRLHLSGDVYRYTAKKPIDSYLISDYISECYAALLEEILEAMDDEIDFRDYDGNGDRIMDTVVVALPESADPDYWWPCSGGYYGYQRFDGVVPGNLCIGGCSFAERTTFNNTWIHELGHAMGLPDYYLYDNIPAGGDSEGLHGDAGWEMMDEALADMSAFNRLMLGWYTEDEVQIYNGGTQSFTLESSQHAPSCLIIPRGDLNGYFSEYFVVESVTNDGNNTRGFYKDFGYPMFFGGGVRILHIQAELNKTRWWTEFKYDNFGEYYDTSNLKERVIRLVNDGGGFFGSGDAVDSGVPGFAWYDSSGDLTVDPGITLTVESLADGTAVVKITQN